MDKTIYDFSEKTITGETKTLAHYKGKALLIVNVASRCGLTPQYEALEKLHKAYAPKGLAILGFPANEFGAQEPGTNDEIAQFCSTNYGVTFDMFAKVKVKGPGIYPIFDYLTNPATDPKFAGRSSGTSTSFSWAKTEPSLRASSPRSSRWPPKSRWLSRRR